MRTSGIMFRKSYIQNLISINNIALRIAAVPQFSSTQSCNDAFAYSYFFVSANYRTVKNTVGKIQVIFYDSLIKQSTVVTNCKLVKFILTCPNFCNAISINSSLLFCTFGFIDNNNAFINGIPTEKDSGFLIYITHRPCRVPGSMNCFQYTSA